MSFDEFQEFQNELEKAEKEINAPKEQAKKEEDDFGYKEVLAERQKHKDALKERLIKQNFTQKEIDKLFKIISKAEIDMEKVKSAYNYKSKIPGAGIKLRDTLIEIQNKMKADFDKEFNEMILKKKNK